MKNIIQNFFSKQILPVQLFLAVLLFPHVSTGAEITQSGYLNKAAIVSNATIRVNDHLLKAEETLHSGWYAVKRKHQVRLTYHRESRTDVPSLSAWTYTVNYRIYETSAPGTYESGSLVVSYAPGSSNDIYEAIKEHTPATVGYPDVSIKVTGTSSTGTPPADIRLELTTITERYTDIVAANAAVPFIYYDGAATSELRWAFVPGAEEYDVEWTFIDDEDSHDAFVNDYDPFDYKAPVRVTTSNQYYVIDQVYPKGKLYFRVRGVGRHIDAGTDYTHVDVGDWAYKIDAGGGTPPLSFSISASHESNKNWGYTAAYAEDGKSKKGIGYTDGGGKSRQSQATMHSDNTVIVGENKYDLEGRPVIAIMPTPVAVTDPLLAFKYRDLFNTDANLTQEEYDHTDFELGTDPLGNSSGAGNYYSASNPFISTDAFAKYVDDAGGAATGGSSSDGGYPFTQVQYTRDNTGRVSKTTGGAGTTHALGSGHELSYFYGTANSTELHRMFGTNVGIAAHYKKNLAIDANGQVSVSYYDQEERVVATALAGTTPGNLVALDSNVVTEITATLNDNNIKSSSQHKSYSVNQILNVNTNTTHTFSYDMKGVIYGVNINMGGLGLSWDTLPSTYDSCKQFNQVPLCADCKYKLLITVTDPDGLPVTLTDADEGAVTEITRNFSNPDDTANCEENQYSPDPVSFSAVFTKVGNYTVSKLLTLDTAGLYIKIHDAFIDAGYDTGYRNDVIACYKSHTDFGQCDITCGQHCRSGVLETHLDWAADTVEFADSINKAVNYCMKYTCGETIDSATVTVVDAGCDYMLTQMLIDVSPGGKEFTESYVVPETHFWTRVHAMLTDSTGCSDPLSATCIYIVDTIGEDIVAVPFDTLRHGTWKPEWATQLVKAHRDYCHYLRCIEDKAGSMYDLRMAMVPDWDSANTLGMLDPLGFGRVSSAYAFPSGVGLTGPDVVVDTLTGGIDPLFTIQPDPEGDVDCSRYNMLAQKLLYGFRDLSNSPIDIWHYVFDSTSAVYDTLGLPYTKANMWKVFRGLYLAKKLQVDSILLQTVTGGDSTHSYDGSGYIIGYAVNGIDGINPCAVCPSYTDSEVYSPKKLSGTEKEKRDAYDMVADCAEICETNAIQWMEQLEYYVDSSNCDGSGLDWAALLTTDQKNDVKHKLMLYCQNDCGVTNPMGLILASNLSPMDPYLNYVDSLLTAVTSCSVAINYLSAGNPYDTVCPPHNGAVVNGTFPNECFKKLVTYINGTVLPSASTCFNLSSAPDSLQAGCLGGTYLSVSGTNFRLSNSGGCSPVNCQVIRFYDSSGWPIKADSMISLSLPKFANSAPFAAPAGYTFKNLVCVVNTSNNGPSLAYVFETTACSHISLLKTTPISNYCIVRGFSDTTKYSKIVDYDSLRLECIQNLLAHDTLSANEHYKLLEQSFADQYINAHFSNCLSDSLKENFNYEYNSNEYHYTLYYYDQAGNLTQTVPPKGAHLLPLAYFPLGVYDGHTEPVHTYRTRYGYNSLNQVLNQETPDGGLVNYYYDDEGRLRFSQNAKQQLTDSYSYTVYDDLSRIVEVGQSDQASFTTEMNDLAFPSTDKTQVTLTTYDEPATVAAMPGGFFSSGQQFLRTRVATTQFYEGAYTAGSATGLSAATHYSYDEHGNVNELVQENTLLAALGNDIKYKYMKYNYELVSGNVKQMSYQPGKPDQFYHKYVYDADNRLTVAMTSNHPALLPLSGSISSGDVMWEKDAKYFYYKHGPLARTEIGEDKVQGTDYAYTINGWLKGINATTLKTSRDMGKDANLNGTTVDATNNNSFVGTDALGYTLGYFDGDYTSIGTSSWQATTAGTSFSTGAYKNLFNGNIARTTSAFIDNSEARVITMGKTHIYDQLNRLKEVHAYTNTSGGDYVLTNNTFASASSGNDYKELFSYDPNGNITNADRWGNGTKMDEFSYHYEDPISDGSYSNYTNKLRFVEDDVALSSNYADDIDDQSASYGTYGSENYEYDPIGNLIKDQTEEIDNITWNVYGKVTGVFRTTASNKDDIEFKYDPSGQRICKIVKPRASSAQKTEQYWTYTYYTRDVSGNVMATYNRAVTVEAMTTSIIDKMYVKEHDIYGSSRIGIETKNVNLGGKDYTYSSLTYTDGVIDRPVSPGTIAADEINDSTRIVGDKQYELSNHLGNVMVVVSDKKQGVHTSGSSADAEYYTADVISAQDYFAFGGLMPGRKYNTTGTEFGFNGKREDNEINGEGNSYDYGMRIYDGRLGRFLSVDPIGTAYPELTSYQFAGNTPIWAIDFDGLQPIVGKVNYGDKTVILTSSFENPKEFTLSTVELGDEMKLSFVSYTGNPKASLKLLDFNSSRSINWSSNDAIRLKNTLKTMYNGKKVAEIIEDVLAENPDIELLITGNNGIISKDIKAKDGDHPFPWLATHQDIFNQERAELVNDDERLFNGVGTPEAVTSEIIRSFPKVFMEGYSVGRDGVGMNIFFNGKDKSETVDKQQEEIPKNNWDCLDDDGCDDDG